MNALAHDTDFTIVSAPVTEWLVLDCRPSNRTLALAAALADYGAWTPTWKRKQRMPRSPVSRVMTVACIPGLVFIPAHLASDLPHVPKVRFNLMRKADGTPMRRIPDRDLEPMRHIADRPLIPARRLPRVGSIVMMPQGPWQGLRGKVVSCTIRCAKVAVEGFSQPIQMPPCMLVND